MTSHPVLTKDYRSWLENLKQKVRSAQLKAAVQVNSEMLSFYWELGADIAAKQSASKWGDAFLSQLSKDLMSAFPEMKGFSERNLKYIRQWYFFYSRDASIGQQLVAQIVRIPWGHHIAILSKCKNVKDALFYVQNAFEHGWSRNVLVHQIESGLHKRQGGAATNFKRVLPPPQSDLVQQTIKDPYTFDFLTLAPGAHERELEQGLIAHIQKFMMEMGVGFAFVGRQVHLEIGGEDFYLDLLFYHLKLRCYVVIELKTGPFKPEYAGKMNFYLSAVDDRLCHKDDQPSVGIILCKAKNGLIVEYALRDAHKPIGVSAYKLTKALPRALKGTLPTINDIQKELGASSLSR